MTSLRSKLAVLHHELAVDRVRWFDDVTVENYWRSLDAVWYTAGPYDQFNLGVEVDIEELARQTQSYVEAHEDPDNIGRFDSGFFPGPRGAPTVGVSSSPQHDARQDWVCMWENAACASGDGVAAGGEVHARKVVRAGEES